MLSPRQTAKPRIFVDSTESLEKTFHELIPISRAMGVKVLDYTGQALRLYAPLNANLNHQHSAFGGSLFALAALSGWGLMQMKLSELQLDCNTVVMGGAVNYHRPVYSDLECVANLPDNADAVFARLMAETTAEIELVACCECDDRTAMQLDGRYHLQLRNVSDE